MAHHYYIRPSAIIILLLFSIFQVQASTHKQDTETASVDQSGINALLQALEKQQTIHGKEPHTDIVETLKQLGYAYIKQNELQQALSYLGKALDMLKTLRKDQAHEDIASLLQNMGSIHLSLGNYQQSLTYHEQALKMRRVLSNDQPRRDLAMLLQYIGEAYSVLSDIPQSMHYYEQALAMQKRLHSNQPHEDIAYLLHKMGNIYLITLNDSSASLRYYRQAIEIKEKLHGSELCSNENAYDIYTLSNILKNIGYAYLIEGNFQKSLTYSKQALSKAHKLVNDTRQALQNIISIYYNIGHAHYFLGDFKESISRTEYALGLSRNLSGNKPNNNDLQYCMVLGKSYQMSGKYKKSEQCYKEALNMSEELRNTSYCASFYAMLGNLYYTTACNVRKEKHRQKHLNEATQAFEAALTADGASIVSLVQYINFLLTTKNYRQAYTYLMRTITVQDSDSTIEYDATMYVMIPPVLQVQIHEKKLVKTRAIDYAFYLLIHHYEAFVRAGIVPEKSRQAYLAAYKQRLESSVGQPGKEQRDAIAQLLLDSL